MQKTIDRQQLAELYASICVDLSEDREELERIIAVGGDESKEGAA